MLESWQLSFPECRAILCDNVKLDLQSAAFYSWSVEDGGPIIVLFSGMAPIIHALLQQLLGEEEGALNRDRGK